MSDISQWRQQVSQMSEQAAKGSITIEEFHRIWPKAAMDSALGRLIFEDVEDGVEHFPGTLWTGRPDFKSWEKSDARRRIAIDHEILKVEADESRLMKVREALLAERDLSLDNLHARVVELLDRMP